MPELHNHHGQTEPIWYGESSPIEYKPFSGPVSTLNSFNTPERIQNVKMSSESLGRKINAENDEVAKNPIEALDECFYKKCDPFEEFKLFGKTDV